MQVFLNIHLFGMEVQEAVERRASPLQLSLLI
jgi:hypothetical protein